MTLLTEKSIAKILHDRYPFFIPSYQRGYRWTDTQAKELLSDIWEFSEKDKSQNEWYCLQPIVVLKNNDNQYEVIDGQQRLTTIYLILKYLSVANLYTLEYETRKKSENRLGSKEFLENIKIEYPINNSNIDFWHISTVYKTISNFFNSEATDKSKTNIDLQKFKETFLNQTKVIWYEVNSKVENVREESIKIFTRINMGKIPLTNAELIKALFLNSSNFKVSNAEQIRLKQLEIAGEWDRIEYALQNEEFWWFLNKGENKIATRIEFIFDLIIKSEENSSGLYFIFNEFKKDFSIEKWKEIKQSFQTLEAWFIDHDFYHKIGYLISIGVALKTLYKNSKEKSKSEFIKYVNILINENLPKNEVIDELKYGNSTIKNLLLWHNIHTLIHNKNGRFPFDKYKVQSWDIEHIHATADETKLTQDNIYKWIEDNWVECTIDNNNRIKELKEKTDKLSDEELIEIKNLILGDADDFIQNLCLLDRTTNRSYKNDSFKYKRIQIIERDKSGVFIPIATRNVFLKLYNKNVTQMELWNPTDRNAYLIDIKNSLNFTTNETK